MRVAWLCGLVLLLFVALPGQGQCSAEYTGEQCEQLNNDIDDPNDQGGGGKTCPYYLCGNAGARAQSAYVWCPESVAYVDCPIYYCQYSPCIGTNCYVTSVNCTACASQAGNNGHESTCPRT